VKIILHPLYRPSRTKGEPLQVVGSQGQAYDITCFQPRNVWASLVNLHGRLQERALRKIARSCHTTHMHSHQSHCTWLHTANHTLYTRQGALRCPSYTAVGECAAGLHLSIALCIPGLARTVSSDCSVPLFSLLLSNYHSSPFRRVQQQQHRTGSNRQQRSRSSHSFSRL